MFSIGDRVGGKEKLNDLEHRFLEGMFTPFDESGGRMPFTSSENVEAHVQPSKKRKGKILVLYILALESVLNCMLLCSVPSSKNGKKDDTDGKENTPDGKENRKNKGRGKSISRQSESSKKQRRTGMKKVYSESLP